MAGLSVAPSVLAVTVGEPAGIGPDLCLWAAQQSWPLRLVFVGCLATLHQRAQQLNWDVFLPPAPDDLAAAPHCSVIDIPVARPVIPGRLDAANAQSVLRMLTVAAQGCLHGRFAGVVTAPVHKGIINQAGVAFSGHTEFFAQAAGVPQVVMLLVDGVKAAASDQSAPNRPHPLAQPLRVALVTTHLPLRDVPDAITPERVEGVLRILLHDLRARFGLAQPRVLVTGLNPHAGEGGHLGHEEQTVLIPLIQCLQAEGWAVRGPYPADTVFTPHVLQHGDAILAMYHDQGLATLKYASFGQGVNVTLGLPFVRTSVDHGTALDVAASGRADTGSFAAAIHLAADLVARAR